LLGWPVAIEGDTIVAGASGDDFDEVLGQGSAYVYEKPDGGWADMNETAKLVASDGSEGDRLGVGLAISGNRIAVGASGADSGDAVDQGAVYVFERPAAGWSGVRREYTKIIAGDGESLDGFGYSISAAGDLLLVGAPDVAASRGAAYMFDVPAARLVWLPLAMN